jgi:putative ABC transport system permease protein
VAVAALCVAVAASIGMDVMVDSFRHSVRDWLDRALFADLFVSAAQPAALRSRPGGSPEGAALTAELADELARLPGVAAVSTNRLASVESSLGPVRVSALGLPPGRFDSLQLLEGEPRAAQAQFEQHDAVLVSETLAFRENLRPGDLVELYTAAGPRPFRIAGTARDYASDRGALRMSRATWARHWPGDDALSSVGLVLAPGADLAAVRKRVRAALPPGLPAFVTSSRDLQRAALAVFERTFAVTRALRAIALIVAFAGVLGTALALVLDRARELALLRALGLLPAQLHGLVYLETGLMGAIAGLLAAPLGLAVALALIHAINRRSFGWTLETHIAPGLLALPLGLALGAALLAGVYPAQLLARRPAPAALRQE